MPDPTPIVNALIKATEDSDEDVALTALEALAKYQSEIAIEFLVKTLSNKSLKMQGIARSILTQQHHPAVIPLLIEDLKSPRGYVRLKAAELLAVTSDQSCVPELLKCLQDEHPEVRRHAATALGNCADSSAFDKLFAVMIGEDDKDASQSIATAIGKVGTMNHVQVVLEEIVVRQTDGTYRGMLKDNLEHAATELLTRLGDVDGLLAALQHENTTIRLIAARVLGQLQDAP